MSETLKGTLSKTAKGAYLLNHLSSNGKPMVSSVPADAKCFRDADFSANAPAEYEAQNGRITKVWIAVKPVVAPSSAQKQPKHSTNQSRPQQSRPQQSQQSRSNQGSAGERKHAGDRPHSGAQQNQGQSIPQQKAQPKFLGMPFTNPYTFMPFNTHPSQRSTPVWRTAEEKRDEKEPRYTGFLDVEVVTQRPLLSCLAKEGNQRDSQQHQTLRGLCIGNDVVVPRTGIRGSLRSLMSLISGGSLTQLQPRQYLCQGRDLVLLVPGYCKPINEVRSTAKDSVVAYGVLARVVKPGTHLKPGTVEIGDTKLVFSQQLITAMDQAEGMSGRDFRKRSQPLFVEIGLNGEVVSVSSSNKQHRWQAKISGMPIGGDNNHRNKYKREGVFRGSGQTLSLPPELWEEFNQRHESAAKSMLKQNDLVWLEISNESGRIEKTQDVASLQWARWGRRGSNIEALIKKHHPHALPDARLADGMVDAVTSLFGHIPDSDRPEGIAFAARIYPENLVFHGARSKLMKTTLAALGRPHPGCNGFYRRGNNPDAISRNSPLAGRKVYRVAKESDQPWLWNVQPVFDNARPKPKENSQNKTVDLLPGGQSGSLRIGFRSLSISELALLVAACDLPWRLGGGKPLGLGLCSVRILQLCDELGQPLEVPGWEWTSADSTPRKLVGWQSQITQYLPQLNWWIASQQPVEHLRYPRAAEKNNYGVTVGGHVWFVRHCTPKKPSQQNPNPNGLEARQVGGQLKRQMEERGASFDPNQAYVAAQPLPDFDPADLLADLLYGYDGFAERGILNELSNFQIAPSNPQQPTNSRGENTNPNAQDRSNQRRNRRN